MRAHLAQVDDLLDLQHEGGDIKDKSQSSMYLDWKLQKIHLIYIDYVGTWGRDMNGKFSGEQKIGHEEI